MPFRFRVRFRLPAFSVPRLSDSPVELFAADERAVIRLLCPEAVAGRREPGDRDSEEGLLSASIYGEPYGTEEEALVDGERAKTAILLWALDRGFGIGFLAGTPTRVEVESTTEHFLHVNLTVHLPIDRTVNGFSESIRTGFRINRLPPKVLLALELFAAAYFDSSVNSQFVMRVTAIEALMQQAEASSRVQTCIERLSDVVRSQDLEPKERDDLLRALHWLKFESKTRTGVKLAESRLAGRRYGRSKPGKMFRRLYQARSRIVHEGNSGLEQKELIRLNAICEVLVKDLIEASY